MSKFLVFIKWVIIALVVGGIVGLIGTFFHFAIEEATLLRGRASWLIYLLPFGGLIIVFLYKHFGDAEDKGTNLVLLSIHSNKSPLSIKMAPLIFIGTTLTHLFGGSSGREGAALQLGGSIGAFIGKQLKLDENDIRVITMCGMSAAFSALFGTPLTASIFSLEVISVGVMYYVALVPCVIAALIGYGISTYFGLLPSYFPLNNIPLPSWSTFLQVTLLAIVCAMLSVIFCFILHKASFIYKKLIKNDYLRIFVGGSLIALLTFILGTTDYLGTGMGIVENAINGHAIGYAFLLKLLFTALTLGAGYKGGEIVPAFFVGATFGCVISPLLGLPASFGAAIGLLALFCGVTNCPITSFILSIELFGNSGTAYFMLAIAVSYMLSGYTGLYPMQKIMYSKYKTELCNKAAS